VEERVNRSKIGDVEVLLGRIMNVEEELDRRAIDNAVSEWFT